ncbi:hypothetical protein ACO0LG_08730 [Undibacterium sp. Ji42W]|uniref:hypothetical protein n=1 Tax=Undibacterium sp. Ji42W TaxID=3413039 RepID=UPI003BF42880
MFEKINSVINLFRKGNEVANVELWKTGGISVAALAAAIGALIQFGDAFGVHVSISAEQANGLAIGIVTLVGVVLPVITSKRAGVLPAKREQSAPVEDHSFSSGVPAVAETAAPPAVQPKSSAPAIYDSENPLAGLDTTYIG